MATDDGTGPQDRGGNLKQEQLTGEIARNIERYLNDHTRDGGKAWQMNMAARPEKWNIILPGKNADLPMP